MTPIDKAIKALEQAESGFGSASAILQLRVEIEDALSDERAALIREMKREDKAFGVAAKAVAQALADLSSIKLEDGDVEWTVELLNEQRLATYFINAAPNTAYRKGRIAHNARIDRLLAFLGHGGEG